MRKKRYFQVLDMDYNLLECSISDCATLPNAKQIVKQFLKENNLSSALLQINDFQTDEIIDYREISLVKAKDINKILGYELLNEKNY